MKELNQEEKWMEILEAANKEWEEICMEKDQTIQSLSSANSLLKSELLKKSEIIVSLNERIVMMNESDRMLTEARQMMSAAERLQKENEEIRADLDEAIEEKRGYFRRKTDWLREWKQKREDEFDKKEQGLKAWENRLKNEALSNHQLKKESTESVRKAEAALAKLERAYTAAEQRWKRRKRWLAIYGLVVTGLLIYTCKTVGMEVLLAGIWPIL